ncbi:hypothetical protein [Candidatus Arsenophonus triatominarum]|uniref:hypothetical protein n=1 Tax=Candidatus Arsenophonus triatominarum TaxID=57911 RepID=UPI00164EDC37|nr:hypothetical protein [Candidatus Arsenophonus triatominarum]
MQVSIQQLFFYSIQKPTKATGWHISKKDNSMKKKINLLFLLMKVVFHMTLHELTAIPQKVTVVLA